MVTIGMIIISHPDEFYTVVAVVVVVVVVATDSHILHLLIILIQPLLTLQLYNLGFNFGVYGTFPVTLVKHGCHMAWILSGHCLHRANFAKQTLNLFWCCLCWYEYGRSVTICPLKWTVHLSAFFMHCRSSYPVTFFTVDNVCYVFVCMALVMASLYVCQSHHLHILFSNHMGLALGSRYPLSIAFHWLE